MGVDASTSLVNQYLQSGIVKGYDTALSQNRERLKPEIDRTLAEVKKIDADRNTSIADAILKKAQADRTESESVIAKADANLSKEMADAKLTYEQSRTVQTALQNIYKYEPRYLNHLADSLDNLKTYMSNSGKRPRRFNYREYENYQSRSYKLHYN